MSAPASGQAVTTPARSHAFPQLDGLRAIAALSVVLTHVAFLTGQVISTGPFAPLLARLNFGVTLFFLLSGFLLYRPFVRAALTGRPAPGLGRFWLRRALRIFPAYWLALAVLVPVAGTAPFDAGDLVAYATLTHTYTHAPGDPALTQMWTLVVELAFYLVLPLLARVSLRGRDPMAVLRRQAVLLLGLVAGTIAYVPAVRLLWPADRRPLLWLPAYLDWFAVGMALAVASVVLASPELTGRCHLDALRRMADDTGTCWVIGGLLLWTATLPLAGPRTLDPPTGWEWAAQHGLYGTAAAFFMLPCVLGDRSSGRLRGLLGARPLRWLGEVSYGIYLWHLGIIVLVFRVLDRPFFGAGFWSILVPTLAVTVAVAAASYRLLERPLLSLGRRRTDSRSSSGTSSPASATAQQS
ncbi:MAG TPA: acyltransferase [Mycobacteriales bacterium]